MELTGEELRRRIVAAAALQGLGLRALRDALADFGADKTLAEGMFRGRVPQNPRNIRDLAETLGMPTAWFTEEDWRALVDDAPPLGTELADSAVERAQRILAPDEGKPIDLDEAEEIAGGESS